MHIICPREELQKGVSIVSKAVSNKTTMPILECILIQTKEGRILMTANDMELGIETEIHGIISFTCSVMDNQWYYWNSPWNPCREK